MASGSYTGGAVKFPSGSTVATPKITWELLEQNKEGNYSKVRVNLYAVIGGYHNTTWNGSLNAYGVSKTGSATNSGGASGTNLLICSLTVQVNHKSDGTGMFNLSGSITSSAYGSGSVGTKWVSLPAIPRQATIQNAPNFNDEENPTITYYNPLGEEAAGLAAAISFDGTNPDIEYRDIDKLGTEYTFVLTEEERNILRAGTTGNTTRTVRFYLRTIIGEEYVFSYKEVNFTVIDAEPVVVASVKDINAKTVALTGDENTLIRYNSTAQATMVAAPIKLAEIRTYNIEHNGKRTSGDTLTVENVNGNTFAFIVSDNRGNTTNELIVSPMIDYIRPTVNMDPEQKMNTDGEYLIKCEGNYYNDTFGYTSAATANTLTLQYRYKTQSGNYGAWNTIAANITDNTYKAEYKLTGLNYRSTYVFQCRIIDKLNTVLSAEITVRSIPVFHWSGEDFTFEVPVKFNAGTTGGSAGGTIDNIDGDLTITGNLRMKGDGNYGNTIYFGDSSYAYITETTDDDITIKATDINLQGNLYINGTQYSGSDVEYGTWTPTFAASSYISSYSIQQGWYQKVGNVITLGFMVKATTNSGGIGTIIRINGAPYTPSVAAFGGGVAHNAYISGGFTFTGWTIDDTGVISGRAQSCNNTSSANHEITSTVCYGTSSSLMTLSGTICYMV